MGALHATAAAAAACAPTASIVPQRFAPGSEPPKSQVEIANPSARGVAALRAAFACGPSCGPLGGPPRPVKLLRQKLQQNGTKHEERVSSLWHVSIKF